MRLWHYRLLTVLPRQQLLGQHRECCALRGRGWGKKHATVNYVFDHSPRLLFQYHLQVIGEMERRGYHCDPLWKQPLYRGKIADPWAFLPACEESVYPEHTDAYLQACLDNLQDKGIFLKLPE